MTLITIVIALVSFALMFFILIQNPKGGGIDSTFGGSQANQLFGAAGSTEIVEKITWGLAAALFILCIVASLLASNIGTSGEQLLSQ
ncbi:preprotein translocase subunit SecG [Haliscomenobacter sp.]|jgi:preprotein translocase subunit SecG|uniref:preprotein translocase subunit SecG n=1 Tax=Haliscomenobacter sp. TaxID=2717303 RepID=UPI003364F50D